MGMFLQALPMAEDQELSQTNLIDLACRISPGQGGRAPPDQLGRPLEVEAVNPLQRGCPHVANAIEQR